MARHRADSHPSLENIGEDTLSFFLKVTLNWKLEGAMTSLSLSWAVSWTFHRLCSSNGSWAWVSDKSPIGHLTWANFLLFFCPPPLTPPDPSPISLWPSCTLQVPSPLQACLPYTTFCCGALVLPSCCSPPQASWQTFSQIAVTHKDLIKLVNNDLGYCVLYPTNKNKYSLWIPISRTGEVTCTTKK